MITLFAMLAGSSTNVIDPANGEAVSGAAGAIAQSVQSPYIMGDPLSIALWAVALLAIIGILWVLTDKPYKYRNHRRVGPFTRLHNSLTRKFHL